VVFAAQPEFERKLYVPQLRGLKQRMLMRARLEPLEESETAAYIEHRMEQAGLMSQSVFPRDVVAEIHAGTRRVPRLINTLCSRLLERCRELQVKTASIDMATTFTDEFAVAAFDEP
jgi:general secretion pathway protein A